MFSCLKLRYYLLGAHFVIETDRKNLANLSWVLNQTSNSRLTRWAIMLSELDFTVRAKKGTENVVADAISRLPAATVEVAHKEKPLAKISSDPAASPPEEGGEQKNEGLDWLPTREEIRRLQNQDFLYARMIKRLRGIEADGDDVTDHFHRGKRLHGEFLMQDPSGLLVFASAKHQGSRIVLPPKVRVNVFLHFHNLLHHAGFQKNVCFNCVTLLLVWNVQ